MMLVMVLLIVLMFRTSSALAAAYGIAVTGTMVVTSIMAFVVVWRCWNWPLWGAALLIAPMLLVDTVFLVANLAKVVEGGWLPLVVAAFLIMVMVAWRFYPRKHGAPTCRSPIF
jgi:KUP system potassium uptake protein